MQTAYTYARFSSAMQHESSIEAQQDAMAAYAASHGIRIIRQYADRARSGTNDNRPAFQQMIADLRKAPVDYVLVHKADRFARNRYDAAVYQKIIQDRGARLVAVAQDFGTGPEAVILESLMQAMAEYYSLNLSTEIKKGKTVRAKAGKSSGGIAPFGYRHDGKGSYAIVDEEAHYIKKLYDAVLRGEPYGPIIRDMEARGIRGHLGATITSRTITDMLLLPVYAGIFETHVDGVLYRQENHHPAIISPELYEEAKAVLQKKQRTTTASSRVYLCSGITYCGGCGAKMNGGGIMRKGKLYAYYVCKNRCGIKAINAQELEEGACAYVNTILTPEVRAQLCDAVQHHMNGRARNATQRAPQRAREIRKLQKEIDALIANMSAGILPASVLARLSKEIEQKQSRMELLTELSAPPPDLSASMINVFFDRASNISTSDKDPALTRRTIRRFIQRILVFDDHVEFESTFASWLHTNHPELLRSPVDCLSKSDPASPELYLSKQLNCYILRKKSHLCNYNKPILEIKKTELFLISLRG